MENLKTLLEQPDQPGSYYQLLGCPSFCDDRGLLLAAVRSATKFLHPYQNHKSNEIVQRARSLQLLCATAGHTFSDADKWRSYDAELMNKLRDQYFAQAPHSDVRKWLQQHNVAANRVEEVAVFIVTPSQQLGSLNELPTAQYTPPASDHSPSIDDRASLPQEPPFVIENYEVLERLGSGGIGVVYRARHQNLQKLVAIKLLRYDKTVDASAVTRFHREMLAFGKLDHPNIVRATDAGQYRGAQFLVMDLIEGRNLHELVQQHGPLAIAQTCDIVRQTALGLQHAHDQGLVHRDIKPSNVMVTPDGVVKILDLGLAKVTSPVIKTEGNIDPNSELTAVGVIVGTVDYMAPEQLNGRDHVEARSDVYSLGCTMFFLLTGQSPFYDSGSNVFQRTAAHFSQPVPPLSRFRADVPRPVEALLGRMLDKAPQNRLSAGDLARALSAYSSPVDDSVDLVDTTIEVTVVETEVRPNRKPPPLPSRGGTKTATASRPTIVTVASEAPTAVGATTVPMPLQPPAFPKTTRVLPPKPSPMSGNIPQTAIQTTGHRQQTLVPVPKRKQSHAILWIAGIVMAIGLLGIVALLVFSLLPSRKPQTRNNGSSYRSLIVPSVVLSTHRVSQGGYRPFAVAGLSNRNC